MTKKYNKRMLTAEDLYAFLATQNTNFNFSAKDSGYQLSVQIPAQFEKIDEDESDELLMFCDVKIMHSGRNRNKSNVTDDALEKAAKQLAYKPILANFMEYTDEETGEVLKDFTSHDFDVDKDGNTIYFEKQVGSFTSDKPYFKIEEETGHNFLYGKCAIPVPYTDTASIIKRKNGTKVSVELGINSMEFDAKTKELILSDIDIMGLTLLGKNPDTLEDVGEGMKNARLDIADFSVENNSIVAHANDAQSFNSKLIETLEALNTTLSNFNNNTQINQKGGNDLVKFEELLKKYNVTVDDITFDYEGLSDEELEQKFAETFDDDGGAASDDGTGDAGTTDGNSDPEPTSDENVDEGNGENDPAEEPVNEEGTGEAQEENPVSEESEDEPVATSDGSEENPVEEEACGTDGKKKKKYSITVNEKSANFEIALDEKIWALSDLVNTQYGESDNCWYSVKVYENYLIMSDYWTGIAYKQTYSQDGDNFSLTGDRVEVYATYLTKEELDEVEAMRSNYASLVEYKENAEFAKLHTQREEILNAEKYNDLRDTDEFKTLVENMDQYSLVDLEKEAKVIFADFITSNAGTFSAHTSETKSKKKFNGGMTFGVGSEKPEADNENSPYGDYFKSLRK